MKLTVFTGLLIASSCYANPLVKRGKAVVKVLSNYQDAMRTMPYAPCGTQPGRRL